MLRRQKCH